MDKKTFLNWGLTSDWLVEGPRKRRASGRGDDMYIVAADAAEAQRGGSTAERPRGPGVGRGRGPHAPQGYGEMTEGSIERLLVFLRLGSHPEGATGGEKTALSPEKKKNGAENKSRLGTKTAPKRSARRERAE